MRRVPLEAILSEVRILPDLIDLPGAGELYLVGGSLRDWLLGRPMTDFDFTAPGDPTLPAQSFARRIGGHWFFLDEPRRQSRVVVKGDFGIRTYDFTPFRAPDLEGDLRLRDFTINALALPLRHSNEALDLLDPLRGRFDLENAILRGCSYQVFSDDPLRILKGIRHALVLGFKIEPETVGLMRSAAPGIRGVAPERIRAEIVSIFSEEPVASALFLMQSLNCLEAVFGVEKGKGGFHEGVRLAFRCEEVLRALAADGALELSQEIESGLMRGALLKIAAFGRGYSPEVMIRWGDELKFSRRTGLILSNLATLAEGKVGEAASVPSGRPRALWAAQLGRDPLEALVFTAVLDGGSISHSAPIVSKTLRDYLDHLRNGRVPDLIDGEEVRRLLGLPAGPAVGEALDALRREEIAGRAKTPEEGRKFVISLDKK